ncbi:TIGR03984 family CRISPR-associated protein [Scytonema sp. UIC 10036]|uniref:type III-D CRISPR-associated protein Csx19 n=1 Tax=Scytonema sp. UIC 10036 TaxID=2304196 RepID=UPI0012DA1B56|nr:CRISPR-associated protein Csx19 [Scytonema sp. UIC 10036]MUG95757.1 TIGR03984 family CRISPR-associated protein [Scytonema sp. UIC 10036]
MIDLYTQASKKDITLSDAIYKSKKCLSDAIGLLYTPEKCCFVKIKNGKIEPHKDEIINLNSVFEARVFNKQAELRWLNEKSGTGKAVLLSETETNFCLYEKGKLKELDKHPQSYLLWGQGTGTDIGEGWSRLSTARIGKLDIPIPGVKSQQRVQITTCEYFCVIDEHGNVAVVEERLLNLEPIKEEKKHGSH